MGQAKARKAEIDAIKARTTEVAMGFAQGMSNNDPANKGSANYYNMLFSHPNVKQLGVYTMTDLVQNYFGKEHAEDGVISCLLNHLNIAEAKFNEPVGEQIISEITIQDDKTLVKTKVYVVTENYRGLTTVCLKEDMAEYQYAH